MSPETIRERAAAIRLGQKALGDLANRSQKFVNMTLTGRSSPRYDALCDIEKALTAEELRLRNYLLALHPVETKPALNGGSDAGSD